MKIRQVALAGVLLAAGAVALAQAASTGQVRKVDPAAGRVTIEHSGVANLDMPPMTMVFRVQDTSTLSNLKPGDKVLFTAEKVGSTYTVTTLRKP